MLCTSGWRSLALGFAAALVFAGPALAADKDDVSNTSSRDDSSNNSSNNNSATSRQNRNNQTDQARNNESDDEAYSQHHAALGVSLNDDDGRLRVTAVLPGSPASRAGLRKGDEITSVQGERVRTAHQLTDQVREQQPGAQVEIGIRRDGQRQTVRATLVSLDTFHGRNRSANVAGGSSDNWNRGNQAAGSQNWNRGTMAGSDNWNSSSQYGGTNEAANRGANRSGWVDNRGRAASYDANSTNGSEQALHQRISALEQQVARLQAELRGNQANTGRGGPAFQGNGNNDWYYEEANPNEPNQGIHDYGARARDGQ